jgi:hypothetical protein
MDKINTKCKAHLHNLIDELEEQYGNLEGFEVKLEHPIEDGDRIGFGVVKSFTMYYLHKVEVEVDKR